MSLRKASLPITNEETRNIDIQMIDEKVMGGWWKWNYQFFCTWSTYLHIFLLWASRNANDCGKNSVLVVCVFYKKKKNCDWWICWDDAFDFSALIYSYIFPPYLKSCQLLSDWSNLPCYFTYILFYFIFYFFLEHVGRTVGKWIEDSSSTWVYLY